MATGRTYEHGCATCEYWQGERKVKNDPRIVEWSGSGICVGQSHSYRGKQVLGSYRPSEHCWECWRYLKEK